MPTSFSPPAVNATTLGVVRVPSWFSITRALEPSMMATQELVVPRSMPMMSPALALAQRRVLPATAMRGAPARLAPAAPAVKTERMESIVGVLR